MAKSFVEHKPCVKCGTPHTSIMIGPPETAEPYWMCFDCFLLTPSGVALTQGRIRNQLGEIDDAQESVDTTRAEMEVLDG